MPAADAELLADAALVFAGVPVEEREALRADVLAFLREDLAERTPAVWERIEQIARVDVGEPERLQQLLLELCVQIARQQPAQ
jgi:hypothetical protein